MILGYLRIPVIFLGKEKGYLTSMEVRVGKSYTVIWVVSQELSR